MKDMTIVLNKKIVNKETGEVRLVVNVDEVERKIFSVPESEPESAPAVMAAASYDRRWKLYEETEESESAGEPVAETVETPAEEAAAVEETTAQAEETTDASTTSAKAIGSAIAVGLAAAGGALGMGILGSKSSEAIARQPEAEGKIRTSMMLTLVFIETAIIYALLVVILIIFVL